MNANPYTATHLCETCKKSPGYGTCIDIDDGRFDEIIMDGTSGFDRDGNNPQITTIVTGCEEYEKEG